MNEDNNKVTTIFVVRKWCASTGSTFLIVKNNETSHISGVSVFAGTIHHVACLVKNRVPVHVVQCFG